MDQNKLNTVSLMAIHPGEILREEYLKPLNMSPLKLAEMLGVPRTRIERIATEKTAISPDTAMRLAKVFNTTPRFWMNMQASYDLAVVGTDVSRIEVLDIL